VLLAQAQLAAWGLAPACAALRQFARHRVTPGLELPGVAGVETDSAMSASVTGHAYFATRRWSRHGEALPAPSLPFSSSLGYWDAAESTALGAPTGRVEVHFRWVELRFR
jgi:hypothetical protein